MSSNTISDQSMSLTFQLKQAMETMDFAKCQELQAKITALAAVDAKEIATKTKMITKAVDDTVAALSVLKQTKGAIQAFHAEAETLEVETEIPEVEAETLEVEAETLEVEAEIPEVEAETPEVAAETPEVEAVDYSKMKCAELKKLCKERKIKGFSKLKKAELIEKLKSPVSESINEAPKPKKAKKAKKAKNDKVTSENQCLARKWDTKIKNGNKQCPLKRKEGSCYCSSCDKKAHCASRMGSAELVGPDLWKWCYDNGKTRSDTKGAGSAGLWFGRIDQFEEGFEAGKVPVTSFTTDDGRKMVVTCYKDHEKHAEVSASQTTSNAVLCVDLFKNKKIDWPKKWHPIGVAEKTSAQAEKKAARKVKQTVDPGLDSEDEDDEADSVDSFSDDGVSEDEFVSLQDGGDDGPSYRVNRKTCEVVDEDDNKVGMWNLDYDGDKPENPTKDWLNYHGTPDDAAEDFYANQLSEEEEE